MKRSPILLLLLLFFITSKGQQKGSLEITPFFQIDKYPQFSYVLANRPSTDFVKITGTSLGLDIVYRIPLSNSWRFRAGFGYFKYSFNKIDKYNTSFGNATARNILFPSPLFISFVSDTYWYNTLALTTGVEKELQLKKGYTLNLAGDIKNYFTFSQAYHIANDPDNTTFRKNETRYFGTSVMVKLSLTKKIGNRINLGPALMLPLFSTWKTDPTFQEETGKDSRSKISMGVGLGMSVVYHFN